MKDRLFTIFLPVFTVDEVCHISNKFRSSKNFNHINIFTRVTLGPSFIWKILSKYISTFFPKAIGPLCHIGYLKHPHFTICLLVLTVGEVYNISNKNQLPNRSIKYLLFYTRDLAYRLHFQRKLVLSMANVPGNIHFLQLFYWF